MTESKFSILRDKIKIQELKKMSNNCFPTMHCVKAVDPNKGCLIGNNRGRINGWTKSVYGKVVEVL